MNELRPAMDAALASSAKALTLLQKRDGHWCAELTADSTLESDYVLLQLWLHPPVDGLWSPPSRTRIEKACKAVLDRQLADGGWNIYPQGPAEVNATVRAYTALKLGGHSPSAPYMVKARERALALGGLQGCNSYTRINFSLFDLYPKKFAPSVPPEVVMLPVLYEMSSWARAIVVPLSIVQAIGLQRPAPHGFNVDELSKPGVKLKLPSRGKLGPLFAQLDKALKLWERRGLKNVRQAALRQAEHWMLDRTRYADGLGAIYPSMMYLIMALDSLRYADDHPDRVGAIKVFEDLLVESEDRFQFQPAVSPSGTRPTPPSHWASWAAPTRMRCLIQM